MLKQRTIRSPVTAIGVGVHSGKKIKMTLKPAAPGKGIVFVRVDNAATPGVRAAVGNVRDTTLATTLCDGSARVSTVEHLMSAMWGVGIDNLIVELSGGEVPSLDGSAAPFIYLLHRAGIVEQKTPKTFIRIKKPVHVSDGKATMDLAPFPGFKASYTFVYDHPVYNRYPKHVEIDFAHCSFVDDVSRARSFGLVNELEQAQTIDRCQGSSLENSVGIDDYTILNQEGLRYEDEFVKHKLLDLIGDLYLLGHPVLGEVRGYMSGHALNNRLGVKLLESKDAWELVDAQSLTTEQTPKWSLDWNVSPQQLVPRRAANQV